MKAIYKLHIDFGRSGDLQGVFIAEQEKVKVLLENKIEVYWGEVLGKHSEVYGTLSKSSLKMISTNKEAIKVIEDLELESGYNPFHYRAVNFQNDKVDYDGDDDIDTLCGKLIELKETT